jgi:hypothetical protein
MKYFCRTAYQKELRIARFPFDEIFFAFGEKPIFPSRNFPLGNAVREYLMSRVRRARQ